MFKVRQAKATPAPPTRRARIRRTSSRRSGYAFSHAQGYGDLVTSGRFLRRPALTRSSGFTHAGRTTTSFSPMGRSAGYSPTGRPQNNKVPDVEVTSLQMYRTITDSAPWWTAHLGFFGEIWEQIINYWLESYMMLGARSVQRSYLLQWRACLGFPENFMSKIFHTYTEDEVWRVHDFSSLHFSLKWCHQRELQQQMYPLMMGIWIVFLRCQRMRGWLMKAFCQYR